MQLPRAPRRFRDAFTELSPASMEREITSVEELREDCEGDPVGVRGPRSFHLLTGSTMDTSMGREYSSFGRPVESHSSTTVTPSSPATEEFEHHPFAVVESPQ